MERRLQSAFEGEAGDRNGFSTRAVGVMCAGQGGIDVDVLGPSGGTPRTVWILVTDEKIHTARDRCGDRCGGHFWSDRDGFRICENAI